MEYIFSPEGKAVVERFIAEDTLFVFDYDGTLTPLAAFPHEAKLGSETRKLLTALARSRPVAVITGRSVADIRALLSGIPNLDLIGNHGAEYPGHDPNLYTAMVAEWHQLLAERLHAIPGLFIEDKRYSLSVHYRHCTDHRAAQAAVERLAPLLPGVRIVPGHKVLNLVPKEGMHKGDALLAHLLRRGLTHAIFIGDDYTDEDVFITGRGNMILSVRVGYSERSSAAYYLQDQSEIDALFRLLLTLTTSGGAAAAEIRGL